VAAGLEQDCHGFLHPDRQIPGSITSTVGLMITKYELNVMDQVVMLLTCIWQVPGSDVSCNIPFLQLSAWVRS